MERMAQERLMNRVVKAEVSARRVRVGARYEWVDGVKKVLKGRGTSV